MIRSYELRFNYMEMRRRAMIKHFVPFSPEQLAWSPGDGQWSMLQVAQHCWMVDRLVLTQVKKNRKQRRDTIPRASLLSGPRLLWASILLSLPTRLKVPDGVPVIPNKTIMLASLHEQWEQTRLEWKEVLEKIEPSERSNAYFTHPILGSLTTGQTVRFLALHIDHHMMQVIRIIKKPGFPEKPAPKDDQES